MAQDNGSKELIAALKGESQLALRDPEEAAAAIVERILNAPTIEDVFNIAGTLGADDVLERPFTLTKVTFNRSSFEEGSPVYAILTVGFVDDGSEGVITCGGRNVCAQLIAAARHGGEIPFPIMLRRNPKPTAAGFYPLWLAQAPANVG